MSVYIFRGRPLKSLSSNRPGGGYNNVTINHDATGGRDILFFVTYIFLCYVVRSREFANLCLKRIMTTILSSQLSVKQ